MRAVYRCDDRPGDHCESTSGIGAAFHLGLIQAKVTWKINIPSKETYVNKSPPPPQIRDHIPTHTSVFTCAGSPT